MFKVTFDLIARFLPPNIHLTQQEKDEIAALFNLITLDKGDYFLTQGNHVTQIACVISGILCRWNKDKNDKLHIDQFIISDHFFTERKCYEHNLPACYNITALSPCEVLTISTQVMEKLKNSNPKYEKVIYKIIENALNFRKDQDELFLQGSPEERVAHFMVYFKPWIASIPNELIANYLQMSLSTWRKIRNKFLDNRLNVTSF